MGAARAHSLLSRRLGDWLTIGALTRFIPLPAVQQALDATERNSERQRLLPAPAMVYYVLALAFYLQASTREVLRILREGWCWEHAGLPPPTLASKGGLSRARTRLGAAPLAHLMAQLVQPLATPATRGAWLDNWRLVAVDGSTLDVPDVPANRTHFGGPHSGAEPGAYPQLRWVALVECGTHVLFRAAFGSYRTSEAALAKRLFVHLTPDMLCLADRGYIGYDLWTKARASGAALLWRTSRVTHWPCDHVLADGSYLSRLSPRARSHHKGARRDGGVVVRVIEYHLTGAGASDQVVRLVTSVLDPVAYPAAQLAALYAERWEIESTLDEVKTHVRGPRHVLRSKTPILVAQEFWGLLLAHYVVRQLLHEAAQQADEDPDHFSFTHAVQIVRRKLPQLAAFPPSTVADPAPCDAARDSGRARDPAARPPSAARRQTARAQ